MKASLSACCGILLLASTVQVNASDFEAALSSETAQFTLRSDSSVIGWGGADLALSFFYNDNDDYMFSANLLQMGQPSQENPLTFGPGVKAYLFSLDGVDDESAALAIGGAIRYTIPGKMPMHLYADAYFAPGITSFSGADGVIDYSYGFQIEALPQTVFFAGVRHLEVDHEDNNDYELDDDRIHFGIRLTF
jgi:hypothetical protein